ncbi:MAG: DUF1365 domain-containing protein [Burkholderiaceae bacterium]
MRPPALPAAPQALIGFGQVRHTRLRPARHAFAYRTFFLMLPMRALERLPSPNLARNRHSTLSFFDADHGDGRSAAKGGALAWLDELLQSQGIADACGEVWLHCYPRVLGYAFKPVSFWYCYKSAMDGKPAEDLRAIVVEVNNTFGERHCYVLDAPRFGEELSASKVLHVSPFCKVEGGYRFRFMQSTRSGTSRTVARIDYHDTNGLLLQTSVSGDLQPLTAQTRRKALWQYPAMTWGVIARIHWQALRLWLKRVPFHGKAAAPAQSASLPPAVPRQTPSPLSHRP